MNNEEQDTLRELHTKITGEIDANVVVGHFYELKYVTREEVTSIRNIAYPNERTEKLIFILLDKDKCDLKTFLDVLSKNGYEFLAKDILDRINTKSPKDESNREEGCQIPTNMNRVSVYNNRWRHKTSRLAHELTRLVHNGQNKKFEECRNTLIQNWEKHKLRRRLSVDKKLEIADQAFAALDTEIAMKRIKYDPNLVEDPVFELMGKLIPYTSDPIVTSMSFLARRSSATVIGKPVDEGLEHIKYAKVHSESVSPCRESGMVYYIEFNMLAQKYEHDGPTDTLKSELIKSAKASIGHFNNESMEEIRLDFRRMLLLKIANVHLGIGAFGNTIHGALVSDGDIRSAKKILDDLEEPDMWMRMEKRRKMFFYIAKSRLFFLRKQYDLARNHAMSAKTLSHEGGFKKELPHIEELLSNGNTDPESMNDDTTNLENLMASLSDDDTDETES